MFEISFDDEVTKDTILARFRVLSKKYHPDSAEEKYKDGKMFMLLCEAREFILNNLDKFKKASKDTLETDDPRIKEFYNKGDAFVASNKPQEATVGGITYTLDVQKLMKETAKYMFNQLREYGFSYNRSFILSMMTLFFYLKKNISPDPSIWFGYLFSSVNCYLINIDYSKFDIDKALTSELDELNEEEIVVRKIKTICDCIKVGEMSINPMLEAFASVSKFDDSNDISFYIKSYVISNLSKNLEEYKIINIEKFSLLKNKITSAKRFNEFTCSTFEKSIYESEAILRFFGEDAFNHYNDLRNYNSEEQQKFISSLNSGLEILNYSLVDFSKLCKALKDKIFSESIVSNNEVVKMAGFCFIVANNLAAYCKIVGLNPDKDYSKNYDPKGIHTPHDNIGFMLHHLNKSISGGLLSAIQMGEVPHRNIDEVISLLEFGGKSFNGYQENYQKQKESNEQYQKQLEEYRQSQNQRRGGCYIATAVYGSYDCPEVWVLRRYRDYKLRKTIFGRVFIKTYYSISPILVKLFGKTKWFQKIWRNKLDKMVCSLKEEGFEDTPYSDLY